MTDLIEKLSEYGSVEICSKGKVFTLLMTGEKLDKMNTAVAIQRLVTEAVADEFPILEQMRNDSSFYCIVLSKNKPSQEVLQAFIEQIEIQTEMSKKVSILNKLWKN